MKATFYHNSRCSKSNTALTLLLEHGIEVSIINYLETPISLTALQMLLQQLNLEAKALIRFSEPIAIELGISIADKHEEIEWISIMMQHPILIERPIVVINNRAIIARPPERVMALIEENKIA